MIGRNIKIIAITIKKKSKELADKKTSMD